MIFGGLVLVAALVAPPLASSTPGVELAAGVVIAVASLPALALLGAGLTSAALGSRSSAASAGLAMAVGAPVAAVTSAMICTFAWSGVGLPSGRPSTSTASTPRGGCCVSA